MNIYRFLFYLFLCQLFIFPLNASDKAYQADAFGSVSLTDSAQEKTLLLQARLEKDYHESVRKYREFLNQNPSSRFRFIARYELACLYKMTDQMDMAIEQFQLLLVYARGTIYFQKAVVSLGAIYYQKKMKIKALHIINDYMDQVHDDESKGNLYYLLGKIMMDLGQQSKAEYFFNRCVHDYPGSSKTAHSYLELFKLYDKKKEMEKASLIYKKVKFLFSESMIEQEMETYINNNRIEIIDKVSYQPVLKEKNNLKMVYFDSIKRINSDLKISVDSNQKKLSAQYIQLAYLSNYQNALNMLEHYSSSGVKLAFIAKTHSLDNNETNYRIVMGPYHDKYELNQNLIHLKEKNIEAIMLELVKKYE